MILKYQWISSTLIVILLRSSMWNIECLLYLNNIFNFCLYILLSYRFWSEWCHFLPWGLYWSPLRDDQGWSLLLEPHLHFWWVMNHLSLNTLRKISKLVAIVFFIDTCLVNSRMYYLMFFFKLKNYWLVPLTVFDFEYKKYLQFVL